MTIEIAIGISVVFLVAIAYAFGKSKGEMKDMEKLLDEVEEANKIRNDLYVNTSKYERVCERYKR